VLSNKKDRSALRAGDPVHWDQLTSPPVGLNAPNLYPADPEGVAHWLQDRPQKKAGSLV
jgi:hypothetical protein